MSGERRKNTDETIFDVDFLDPVTAGLVRGGNCDTLYKLIEYRGRQLLQVGVSLDKGHKLSHTYGLLLLLVQFSLENLDIGGQRALFFLIGGGQFRKSLVCQFAGNVVLVDTLKQSV